MKEITNERFLNKHVDISSDISFDEIIALLPVIHLSILKYVHNMSIVTY